MKPHALFSLASILLIPVPSCLYSQPVPPSTAPHQVHGTVNIILGNRNGGVVVTDSRLSSDGKPKRFEAPKLFQLDDHTVFSIAGFYYDAGPPLETNSFPVFTLVTDIVENVISHRVDPNASIDSKADRLAWLFRFSLSLVANAWEASGAVPPGWRPSESVLTVVGYENDSIKVKQISLWPVLVDHYSRITKCQRATAKPAVISLRSARLLAVAWLA